MKTQLWTKSKSHFAFSESWPSSASCNATLWSHFNGLSLPACCHRKVAFLFSCFCRMPNARLGPLKCDHRVALHLAELGHGSLNAKWLLDFVQSCVFIFQRGPWFLFFVEICFRPIVHFLLFMVSLESQSCNDLFEVSLTLDVRLYNEVFFVRLPIVFLFIFLLESLVCNTWFVVFYPLNVRLYNAYLPDR